jgi:hypothetical protein
MLRNISALISVIIFPSGIWGRILGVDGMTVIYCGLALLFGYAAGFLTCWTIAKSGMNEILGYLGHLGYNRVDGEWVKPDDPTWKLETKN